MKNKKFNYNLEMINKLIDIMPELIPSVEVFEMLLNRFDEDLSQKICETSFKENIDENILEFTNCYTIMAERMMFN